MISRHVKERKMAPRVAIIVLNWNSWQDTIECLEAAQHLNYPNYQITLVENGSTDDSLKKIREWCRGKISVNTNFMNFSPELKPVEYIEYEKEIAERGGIIEDEASLEKHPPCRRLVIVRHEENLGFADGNNVAIEHSLKCPHPAHFVFLLNNDAWIEPDCVSRAVEVALKKKSGVVSCVVKDIGGKKIFFFDDRRRQELFYTRNIYSPLNFEIDEPSSTAYGTAMLIHRDALTDCKKHYGYFFNPKLFLYGEDTEFCLCANKLGHRIFTSKKSVVYHKESHSIIKQKYKNSLHVYYLTRNWISIANRLLRGKWLVLFHVYHPLARFKEIVRKLIQGKHSEAYAIFKGLVDGYRGVSGKWRKHP